MFLGRVLDETPAVVFLLDDQLVIRWANRTVEAVFGYGVDEVVGSSVLDFVDASSNPVAVESVITAMGGRGPRLPMVFRAKARDGSTLTVEVTANVQLHDPVLEGMVVHLRPWQERDLLDRTLDAMAAGAPAATALGLLVEVLGSETVGAPAALVSDLRDGRAAGIVAAPDLPRRPERPGVRVLGRRRLGLGPAPGPRATARCTTWPTSPRCSATRPGTEGYETLWVWPADQGHPATGLRLGGGVALRAAPGPRPGATDHDGPGGEPGAA